MNSVLHLNPNAEEALFAKKIYELALFGCQRVRFSQFLDERGCALALAACQEVGCQKVVFGGYDDAERQVIGFFPDYIEGENEHFPIQAIHFSFKKEYNLTHRDVLGTIMSQGVKREAVGDILIGEGECAAFVLTSIAQPILNDVTKIKNVGVSVSAELPQNFVPKREAQCDTVVVASQRLDAVVAALARIGREEAQALIHAKQVKHNARIADSLHAAVDAQAVLTIRGFGKFKILNMSATKKSRLRLEFLKYL